MIERRLLAAFLLTMALLLAIGATAWRSMQAAGALAEQAQHHQEALSRLATLQIALTDAETGGRGYVVTGDEAFLQPVVDARDRAMAQLDALRVLDTVGAEGLADEALAALTALAARRVEIVDEIVGVRRRQGFDAAQALVASGEGKQVQDRVRAEIGALQASLGAAIGPAERRSVQARALAQGVIVAGGLVALVFGSWATRRMRRDLVAQRAAESALREREQALQGVTTQLQRVLDGSLDVICTFDADGRFIQVNAACERIWGYRPDELLGRPYIELVHPDDRERTLAEGQAIAGGRPALHFENRYRHKDGHDVHVMWTSRWSAQLQTFFSVARDVSERVDLLSELRRRNDALERQASALRAATERAEAADRTKSAFLATMSHELRTPLNSIIGFTGILLQRLAGPLNDEQVRQLGMVRGSARHLLALINDVLDISKIEAGQLEVACQPYDLGAVVAQAEATTRPLAEARGLALSVTIAPALDARLARAHGDPRRVGQILLNLLGNAVKFTEAGSVAVDLGLDPDDPARVRLTVRDTGIGIAPAQLATLFQPFRQGQATLDRHYEGTGLGLAISQRLARLMGGIIAVESQPGEGSAFTLALPLQAAAARVPDAVAAPADPPDPVPSASAAARAPAPPPNAGRSDAAPAT